MGAVAEPAVLATGLLVAAQIRGCNDAGRPACLVHRGEAERGTILVKIDRCDGSVELWTQVRDAMGEPGWMRALPDRTLTSLEVMDYADRAIARDPDLWVVEIEDPAGVNPFAGALLG